MKIYRTKSKAVEGIDIVNAEMANGRLITFTVNRERTDADCRAYALADSLDAAEKKTFDALVRLGDSPALALETVLAGRVPAADAEAKAAAYRNAYCD